MTLPTGRKDCPLSIRLPEADIAVIDRAARRRGCSRMDFVREAAVRAAENVLLEASPVRMSRTGFTAFVEALSGSPRPVPELVDLLRRPAPWEEAPPKTTA